MTKKSRYFLAGSAVVLLVGLGAGTWAYLAYYRAPGVAAGLPAELKYVPMNAQMVAYADVKSVMASEMRHELERMTTGRRGQQQMHQVAGIDLEKDVNHVVGFMQPDANPPAGDANQPPRFLLLAQGTFDQAAMDQFMKDRGGVIEDYHGKHLLIRREAPAPPIPPMAPKPPTAPKPPSVDGTTPRSRANPDIEPPIQPQIQQMRRAAPQMAIGFIQPDVIALGPTDLVRQALDASTASTATASITSNSEVMALIHDEATANAWVVGQFDAVSRRMGLPAAVRSQMPPLRLVAASARINDDGVKATVKALTKDQAAADQLREVVRGAIAFARMQTGTNPDLQTALKTLEPGGTGNQVQLSFMITPEMLRHLSQGPRPPSAPEPPTPPK